MLKKVIQYIERYVSGRLCSGLSARQAGYALFIAVVVSGIVLAIGLGVTSIARIQIVLSSFGRESQFAFYAADSGAECVFRWDIKGDGNGDSIFPTSTASTVPAPGSGYLCGTTDISSAAAYQTTSGGVVPQPPTSGLAGYWSMDTSTVSGSTIADQSGNGNTLTSTDGVATVAGRINAAFQENGAGTASAPNSASIDMNSAMTISFWIRWTGGALPSWGSFVRKMNTGVSGWNVQNNSTTNTLYMRVDTSARTNQLPCGSGGSGLNSIPGALDGNWHHVAFVLNNGWCNGYKDGAPVSSGTYLVGTGFSAPSTSFTLRGASGLNGLYDDVRLYNRALSAAEIATIAGWTGSAVSGGSATTTFPLAFPDGTCATVSVEKSNNGLKTLVESHGFNDCNTSNPRRVERAIRVRY